MRVNWQDQTRPGVVARVVVGLRRIPIPDEQSIRVREVLDVVLLVRIIEEAEVVRASAQAVVVATILAILGNIGVEVALGLRAGRDMEATRRRGEGPGYRALSALSRATGDADVVHREARRRRLARRALLRHVGPVAEAEQNGLAIIGREVRRQVRPVRGDASDALALVL